VRGCKDWQARGKLDEPAVMRDALQDYRDAQDPFLAFVKERCEVKDDARTLGKEMHTAYGEWCVETFGRWEGSKKADISPAKFYEVARQHGYTVQRMTGGQTVFGLHLKVEAPTPYYGPRKMTA
jgi:phage/plasmid-associated DNA primase